MNKQIIKVPKGIRYISEWKDLEDKLPKREPFILNKSITGCGYTEYCITNDRPTIICSPRKVLLENKEDQHQDMPNLLYLKDEYATFEPFDMDISKTISKLPKKEEKDKEKAKEYAEYMKTKIIEHWKNCSMKNLGPCKFLVTYDSFRKIKEALSKVIDNFTVVVDEFQSIFCDSRFKSDTENSFLYSLQDLTNVLYLSATPMMDEYLEELDEFKNLTYIELDWETEDPTRVIKPLIVPKQCRSIVEEAKRVVSTYKDGKFISLAVPREDGHIDIIESREAVLYVNSVKNICDIIRSCELTLDNTNILCANDYDNEKRVRDAFRKIDPFITTKTKCIGKVPKEGEPHKMFTLCTRTVYLGADFYSTNARSFIFSDANVDCLSVDITLDLPQILGRQRLDENPWKNQAELYYKTNTREKSQEEFKRELDKKYEQTLNLIQIYNETSPALKHSLAEKYQSDAVKSTYKKDYVAVNSHMGSDLKPVFNKLAMISEKRSFEIQQYDYKDRFSVFNSLKKKSDVEDIDKYIDMIKSIPDTAEKYKYFCSLPEIISISMFPYLPSSFQNYYTVLGPGRMRALWYDVTKMRKEYERIMENQGVDIKTAMLTSFSIGDKIPKSEVKDKLKSLYDSIGYSKTPKGTDLGDYFIIKNCKIPKPDGTRDNGYEIIAIKPD